MARVFVDVPLAHLDRPFDYLVPARLDGDAVPGCRVRVRFAGARVDGYVLERVAASDHGGRLTRLERVVSPEPVLAPEVAALARAVADRYAGTMADVLRLAVPPRHARVEGEPVTGPGAAPSAGDRPGAVPPGGSSPDPGPWADYPAGPAFLRALADGRAPRAVWTSLPGPEWPDCLAVAVAATAASGRGALVVVPDARDAGRVDAAVAKALGQSRHVVLTADLGPAERYRRWLAVRRGLVRVVVGTRAAMFAPVSGLGLAVCWDDGDDLHAEPRAPYPHTREVLALRAHQAGAGLLLGGFTRTAEAARILTTGWARPLVAERVLVRARAPRVHVAGDDHELARDEAARTARLPTGAWRVAREALTRGPVLVQVPRYGYQPRLACARCRAPARCATCQGPLGRTSAAGAPSCRWCGRAAPRWQCAECAGTELRAQVVGSSRTAEEMARAFPGVPVRASGQGEVLAAVGGGPALVVATPGAEPVADGGYVAALLLDGWALLGRPDLRAAEEALRRWSAAASLVRPAAAGGTVVVLADPAAPAVQALVRWDPDTFAERELAERVGLRFPPAVRMASLTGPARAVSDMLAETDLPPVADVLGPVATGRVDAGESRALVRVPADHGRALVAALHASAAARSARKVSEHVRVQVDPLQLV